MTAVERGAQDGDDLRAPGRLVGERRKQLELDDQSGQLERHRAGERIVDHLFVLRSDLGHRRRLDPHRREREVQLRVDRARADLKAVTGRHGMRTAAEDERRGIGDRQLGIRVLRDAHQNLIASAKRAANAGWVVNSR